MRLDEITWRRVGLWLSPEGHWLQVSQNHVKDIISNPSKFGVSSEIISALYLKHNEPVGKEGQAREDLIALVLRSGWVRIRNYQNHWSVTVLRPSTAVIDNIRNWIEHFVDQGWMSQHELIKVYDMDTDRLQSHYAIDIVKKHSLEETHEQTDHI